MSKTNVDLDVLKEAMKKVQAAKSAYLRAEKAADEKAKAYEEAEAFMKAVATGEHTVESEDAEDAV